MPDTDLRPAEIRAELEQRVRNDLLGPARGDDEVLFDGTVRSRYLVGMLAPKGTVAVDPERDDDEAEHDDAGFSEDPIEGRKAAKTVLHPSSMGMSFAVEGAVDRLAVTAAWGHYRKDVEVVDDESGETKPVWRREQVEHHVEVALTDGALMTSELPAAKGEALVEGRARKHTTGFWLVTLFLTNAQPDQARNRDEVWLFQPRLTVEAVDGAAMFVGRGEALGDLALDGGPDPEEQRLLDMQYRDHVEFAVGHGIATHADAAEDNPARAVRVVTEFLPAYEVPNTVAATPADTPQLAGVVLDMKRLADATIEELRSWLSPLADGYREWLTAQHARVSDPTARLEGLEEIAEYAVGEANRVADKIAEGIDEVCSDANAAAAFRFANRVMWLQRVHTEAVAANRRQPDGASVDQLLDPGHLDTVDVEANRSWFPFQLAFLLLNLPELTDPAHVDRSGSKALVDLLFFPTGGGKTEAYLGLTAFTFAIRRLAGVVTTADGEELDGGDGVAVLMRYTLRLLTAQQFERAAAMVCAAETIRRDDPDTWGSVPFRLGMWVGGSVSPNRSLDAKDAITSARRAGHDRSAGATPLQLSRCPWCGTGLALAGDGKGNFHVEHFEENPARRTLVYCPDWSCQFNARNAPGEGIPVVTVDEEVYRLLPTFLIGTVDKFAQVPWNGATKLLFGLAAQRCSRHGYRTRDLAERLGFCDPDIKTHPKIDGADTAKIEPCGRLRPPDLIIQDEFHLITGPLGSMAGLYETIVDELAAWKYEEAWVRPKVVASTATIRRATQQARGVFARRVRLFPPQVLNIGDSFFARQVSPSVDTPGRRYLGVCVPGRRLKEVENRVFRTVMAAAQNLYSGEGLGLAADPWMTTVGYFSAIRELAGMRRLADDELRTRLVRINDKRHPGLSSRPEKIDGKRRTLVIEELTSRTSSSGIRPALDRLEITHDPTRGLDGQWPIDLLLATNMISVGVDVPRLGSMVIVGQPKATAEYIQASSRVGRSPRGPGLVVTIANWARPRDLSHFQTFEHYHATFYRHVEALSVTPFADRAIDRGLSAVLVGLARNLTEDWNPNAGAQLIDRGSALMARIVDRIAARAEEVEGTADIGARIRSQLAERLDDLQRRQDEAALGGTLAYQKRGEGQAGLIPLLSKPEAGGWDTWTLPNSLRNTEPQVNLLIDRDKDASAAPTWDFGSGAEPPEPARDTADDTEEVPDLDDVEDTSEVPV